MKFLCDRCKTRYSIGDDRVRGKILKIRCKNCANVITVREGMTDVDAAEPGPRRHKTTTQAPIASSTTSANGALGAAFASALTTKPPAALEEEWYVSIDGEQDGPFSLAEAQRWVGGKAFDADLHCWSEGFDDWLPVDKVSHFRGLRKKPAPAPAPMAPPPLPRVGGGAARIGTGTGPASAVEDEPKPLFAATMASLEKSAPAASNPGLALPTPTASIPSALPGNGKPAIQARTNGAAAAIKIPSAVARPALRANTTPGVGAKIVPFDTGDSATQIESAPFDEETSTAAEPVAAAAKRLAAEANDAFAKAAMGHAPKHEVPAPAPRLANAPLTPDTDNDDDDDDDLQIGEVSRVVNLADLMRPRTTPIPTMNRTGPVPRMGLTGPVPRMGQTGAVPRMGQTGMVPRIDDPNAPGAAMQPFGGAAMDPGAMPAPVAAHHRRGLIMLIGVALLLLAGVVIAVVLLMFGGDDPTNSTLAGGGTIDTTRPDDPTRKANPLDPGPGSAAPNPFFPTKTPVRKNPNINTNPNPNTNTNPELPTGSLRSDEIEDMARKYSTSTQRCYMRSQKGADLIMMGDVKKIQATLSIGPDGVVKDVTLSQHATTNLGKCLISSIKSWKFRTSPGGLFKISLQFVAG